MNARMPEEFYELVVVQLPEEREPGPQGGRRPIDHYTVLKVVWFVLVTGCRWKDVPRDMGCCGETARTRVQVWEEAGIWDTIHHTFLVLLRRENQLDTHTAIIDSTQVRAFVAARRPAPAPWTAGKQGPNTRCWSIDTGCRW